MAFGPNEQNQVKLKLRIHIEVKMNEIGQRMLGANTEAR
jgi:hypothetical protein